MSTIVVVESPAKAVKIQKMLGKNYIVKSSFGHLRNLKGKNKGVDVANNFKPIFEITKRKEYKALKSAISSGSKVILASDEDREGEAIAWHIADLFKINLNENNRIVFNEITKGAIIKAIENPRKVNMELVNAQKSRQILDYLVGFEISPMLWKFIKGRLSAGRVQSVAVKIIQEKENKINSFERKCYFHTTGEFKTDIKGLLNKKFEEKEETLDFLNHCKKAIFNVEKLDKKRCKRKPPPPFTTSTVQIETAKRFHIPVKSIMNILQKLYENGKITYHRTDSTNLSKDSMKQIKKYVVDKYGKKYLKLRKFKTKTKCAQEAHEAIRPTNIDLLTLNEQFDDIENKIYKLIWKRTVASQMTEMEYDKYTLTISISEREEKFVATAEKTIFEGYRIIYNENIKDDDADSDDDVKTKDEIFEELSVGDELKYEKIESKQKYTNPPPRYNEATLVKEMEKLGVGRPSTYASIITTVQNRQYIKKKNFKGKQVDTMIYSLNKGDINEKKTITTIGKEKNKLYPTELGTKTNEFMEKNFGMIMDYKFTSKIENDLDRVANGEEDSKKIIKKFYNKFHPIVDKLSKEEGTNKDKNKGKRLIGKDHQSGKNIYGYVAKYGPVLQIGEDEDKEKRFVNLDKKFNYETINEIEANSLTQFPKNLGKYEENDIIIKKGRYGYYISYNSKNYKIKSDYNEYLSLENAIECIRDTGAKKIYKTFGTINVRHGPYGPYIQRGKTFVNIPSFINPEEITEEKCKELIKNRAEYKQKSTYKKKYYKKK